MASTSPSKVELPPPAADNALINPIEPRDVVMKACRSSHHKLRKSKFRDKQQANITCLQWNHSGTVLASASDNGTICIWSMNKKIEHNAEHMFTSEKKNKITQILFNPVDENQLASISEDGSLKIFNIKQRSNICTETLKVDKYIDKLLHMVWASDGHILAISSGRSVIHFFDTKKYFKVVRRTRLRNVSINDMYFTMDMKYFILMTGRYVHNSNDKVGHIEVYSYDKAITFMYREKAHDSTNLVMKVHANERLLVTGSLDGMVGIWDFKELVCLHMIDRFVSKTSFVGVSYDGSLVASSSESDTFMDIADVESGNAVDNITGTISHGSWHPTSYLLAYATVPTPVPEKDELDVEGESDDDRNGGYRRSNNRSSGGRNNSRHTTEEESYIHLWGLKFGPSRNETRKLETTSAGTTTTTTTSTTATATTSSGGGGGGSGGNKRYRSGDRKRNSRT